MPRPFKHRSFNKPPIDYAKVRSSIVSALSFFGPKTVPELEDLMIEQGHSRPATRQAVRYLKEDGYIEQEKPGLPYKITMRGHGD